MMEDDNESDFGDFGDLDAVLDDLNTAGDLAHSSVKLDGESDGGSYGGSDEETDYDAPSRRPQTKKSNQRSEVLMWQRRTNEALYVDRLPSTACPIQSAAAEARRVPKSLFTRFCAAFKAPVVKCDFVSLVQAFKGEYYANGGPSGLRATWDTISHYAEGRLNAMSPTVRLGLLSDCIPQILSYLSFAPSMIGFLKHARFAICQYYPASPEFARAVILHHLLIHKFIPLVPAVPGATPPHMMRLLNELFITELGDEIFQGGSRRPVEPRARSVQFSNESHEDSRVFRTGRHEGPLVSHEGSLESHEGRHGSPLVSYKGRLRGANDSDDSDDSARGYH